MVLGMLQHFVARQKLRSVETEHLNLVTFVLGLGHGGVVRVPAGEGGVQEQQQGGHSPHLPSQVILSSATPTPTSNIPYGQSSAKLPVLRSLGHLGHFTFSTWLQTETNKRTNNIRVYRSASQTTITPFIPFPLVTCHHLSLVTCHNNNNQISPVALQQNLSNNL